jgi:hypothetical protein
MNFVIKIITGLVPMSITGRERRADRLSIRGAFPA